MNELVSVIIPTYKRATTLERAINSATDQTYDNVEIIVVDDNASDEPEYRTRTRKLESKYSMSAKIHFVFPEKNLGGAGARNFGVKKSCGKYVSFLDDDDIFLPDKIAKMVARFDVSKKQETINYCFAKDTSGHVYDRFYEGSSIVDEFKMFTVAATSQLMVERQSFIASGCFDVLPSKQDANLLIKMLMNGNSIICTPEVLNVYSTEEATKISTSGNFRLGYTSMFEKYKKVQPSMSRKDSKLVGFSLTARQLREEILARNVFMSIKLMGRMVRFDAYKSMCFVATGMKESYLDKL